MRAETWRRRVWVLMAGGVPLLMAAPSAGWEQERWQQMQEMRQRIDTACQESLDAFCAEVHGRERIPCLMEHHEQTSATCQEVLDEARQRHEQERERRRQVLDEACGEDAETLCPELDGPERFHCLTERDEETSDTCRTLLDRARQRHGRVHERGRQMLADACGEDVEALCPEEEGPELLRCLMENDEDVSAECQSLLDEIQARGGGGRYGRRG